MPKNWTEGEVKNIVKVYFDMLLLELQGKKYNKSEYRRNLSPQLNNRSDSSIEMKHHNISAVLIEMGVPFISGYKPLKNYQRAVLPNVIESHLGNNPQILDIVSKDVDAQVSVPTVEDILKSLVEPPEPSIPSVKKIKESCQTYKAKHQTDYLAREASNQSLGKSGEQFIINYEMARLIQLGKERLADRIEQVSVSIGDSAGYDIHSYEATGKDRFIEVKTTKYGKETPFYVTTNELQFSNVYQDKYFLYRVFGFRESPMLYTLPGFLRNNFQLSPTEYSARR